MRLTQLSSWRLPSAPTYLISHDHVPGPESTFRFVPLWQTVEVSLGRLTGLPWRCRDWAYWLENVAAKSCSTRPRVVSAVHAANNSAAAPAAHSAAARRNPEVVMPSPSGDVAAPKHHEADRRCNDEVDGRDEQPASQRRVIRRAVEDPAPGRHRVPEQDVAHGVPRVEERVQLHHQSDDDRHDDPQDAAAR